jgi:hypothetical protein
MTIYRRLPLKLEQKRKFDGNGNRNDSMLDRSALIAINTVDYEFSIKEKAR